LICHAPALITTIPEEENPFIGYKVNSVSPLEEIYIEKLIMKGKPKNRMIAKQLKRLGLKYERGGTGQEFRNERQKPCNESKSLFRRIFQ
jgi:hypothetical protein